MYADNTSIWHHMSDALHQSFYRVLTLLIAILPGILAFFVALAMFTADRHGDIALLRRGFAWVKFDDRLSRNRSKAEWTPTTAPSAKSDRPRFVLGLRAARAHHRRFCV